MLLKNTITLKHAIPSIDQQLSRRNNCTEIIMILKKYKIGSSAEIVTKSRDPEVKQMFPKVRKFLVSTKKKIR